MKLGSEEIKEKISNKYFKFHLGKVYEIKINKEFDIVEKQVEVKNLKGEFVKRNKYDLEIEVENEIKIWSVSKRVLNIINNNIDKTVYFNVIMTSDNYNIIPLIK